MAHRQFFDPSGAEWTVYDVIPRADERRERDRRDGAEDLSGLNDRRGDDRRAAIRTSRPVRLTRGWLCFENAAERRRLQPIPEGWHLRSDTELSEFLELARVAPRRNRRLSS